MKFELPTAQRFEEWVVGEVLPTIRKTGSYTAGPAIPQTYSEALRLPADEHELVYSGSPRAVRSPPDEQSVEDLEPRIANGHDLNIAVAGNAQFRTAVSLGLVVSDDRPVLEVENSAPKVGPEDLQKAIAVPLPDDTGVALRLAGFRACAVYDRGGSEVGPLGHDAAHRTVVVRDVSGRCGPAALQSGELVFALDVEFGQPKLVSWEAADNTGRARLQIDESAGRAAAIDARLVRAHIGTGFEIPEVLARRVGACANEIRLILRDRR